MVDISSFLILSAVILLSIWYRLGNDSQVTMDFLWEQGARKLIMAPLCLFWTI